jgi:hypothetical protein
VSQQQRQQNGPSVAPKAGAIVKAEVDGSITTEIRAETAAVAVAAAQEALVKARVALARANTRDIELVRTRILKDCARPGFAEEAVYAKPVGKKKNEDTGKWEEQFVEGPSVRLAEAFLRQLGNIYVDAMVVADDPEKRIVKVMAMDLETNATDAQDVTVRKTVERRDAKGRTVISERYNSYGDKVFTVVATEDELLNLVNAAVAKMRRNKVLSLAPADIVEEAMAKCRETTANADAKDPDAAKRKLIDAFAEYHVGPDDLTAWLGHSLDKVTPPELLQLRKIYAGVKSGEMTWATVMDSRGAEAKSAGTQAPPAPPAAAKPATPAEPAPQQAASQPAPADPPKAAEPVQQEIDLEREAIQAEAAEAEARLRDQPPPAPEKPAAPPKGTREYGEWLKEQMSAAESLDALKKASKYDANDFPADMRAEIGTHYMTCRKALAAAGR